jgi:hypothetical protein
MAAMSCAPLARAEPASTSLAFRIDEGSNLNSFVRAGDVAAHLLLRSGQHPRILVAFPAGNSGVALWCEDTEIPVEWTLIAPPRPVSSPDSRRRELHGIEFTAAANVPELRIRAALLSSVRVLRDYELLRQAPSAVIAEPTLHGAKLIWSRDRLDGASGYRLEIESLDGARAGPDRFTARSGGPLKLRIRALTGETPLVPLITPIGARGPADRRSRDVLEFLSYEDKFLAGSWRFNTYFGRDTLISALLLAPVLEPAAMEAALSSVLDRLSEAGEVAHEEDIGEFAVLRNEREGRGRTATPIYDYGMVDDDFLLAPLAARWMLDDPEGRARARDFLKTKDAGGRVRGTALARNLAWVIERTAAYAREPRSSNLVSIKTGRMTGNWRDSELGLGGGRYAYDVNAALVPAALRSVARIADAGLLDGFLDERSRALLHRAGSQARAWEQASRLFVVEVPADRARAAILEYARETGVDAAPALRALGSHALKFHALALDERGEPIPILHSDEGFRLLLTDPGPEELASSIEAILKPFPAGLMTSVGMLVANPALADVGLQREFSRFAYHGTVVWSWQQALMAAGLERQLHRTDLPVSLRARLLEARDQLWHVIERTDSLRNSELWSWSWTGDAARGDAYRLEPFGRAGVDADESNAAQLWSTVYLGLRSPRRDISPAR